MKTRKILLTLSLAVVLVAGGLVVASNMGFKFVPNFSITGRDYWLSLSYNNQYTNAQSLCQDIGPNTSLVSNFDTASNGRQDWTCPFGNNFTIQQGKGYIVRVSAATTPVLVGSHAPGVPVPTGGGWIASGRDHLVGIPYHTQATNAQAVCLEVGADATLVSRFDTASNGRQDWTCPFGNNFPVNVGEALAVRVGPGGVGGTFVPSHY